MQDGSGRRDRKSRTERLLIDSSLMVIFYGRTVATTDAGALLPCTRGGGGGGGGVATGSRPASLKDVLRVSKAITNQTVP